MGKRNADRERLKQERVGSLQKIYSEASSWSNDVYIQTIPHKDGITMDKLLVKSQLVFLYNWTNRYMRSFCRRSI